MDVKDQENLIPVGQIERAILWIRNQKIMLDADLARLYGVPTKRLNEQVKRNRDRFPPDFMFQLTENEKAQVVANCDHLVRFKFSPVLPFAFTEYGAVMLASVLNSQIAVSASGPTSRLLRPKIKPRIDRFASKIVAPLLQLPDSPCLWSSSS